MKQQCGGLQTFLRNQHQVFKVRIKVGVDPCVGWWDAPRIQLRLEISIMHIWPVQYSDLWFEQT